MPNLIDCPACGRKLRVPQTLAGTPVKCPTCNQTFTAPSEPSPFAAQAATPPPRRPADGPPPLPESLPPAGAAPTLSSEAATDAKICPYCSQRIRLDATRCLFCGIDLTRPLSEQPEPMLDGPDVSRLRSRRRDSEPHRGGLILTLGILSFLPIVGLPLGITAWAMAHKDLKKMRSDEMDAQGADLTQGGMICGIIGTLLQTVVYGCCGFCVLGTAAGSVKRPPPLPPAQTVPLTPDPVEE